MTFFQLPRRQITTAAKITENHPESPPFFFLCIPQQYRLLAALYPLMMLRRTVLALDKRKRIRSGTAMLAQQSRQRPSRIRRIAGKVPLFSVSLKVKTQDPTLEALNFIRNPYDPYGLTG